MENLHTLHFTYMSNDKCTQVTHLRTFVKGVKDYYALLHGADDSSFTIPGAMVRFALSQVQPDPDEHHLLLKDLQRQRHILDLNEATITFSREFISSDN